MKSTLKIGSTSPEVSKVQGLLNSVLDPSPNLKVNGIFGPETEVAVKQFQGANGLEANGIVDPKTRAALESVSKGKGQQSRDISKIQALLNSILDPSPNLKVNGKFDAETKTAVKRFQKIAGLKVDGIVGPKTRAALEPGRKKVKYLLPDVYKIQEILNSILNPSPNLNVDGIFGPKTETAGKRFQGIVNLKVDGIVGPQTWAALEPGQKGLKHHKSTPAATTIRGMPSWMEIALQEVGTSEIPGTRHNSRIIQYHGTTSLKAGSDEIAWCSSFVNWCFRQVHIRGSNSAAAASWLNWGNSSNARAGAVAVIHNPSAFNSRLSRTGNHVAFLVEEAGGHYILLGGNQSDQVRISSYPKSLWQLKGYRWPSRHMLPAHMKI